ncbi:hypothetical protein DPMN_019518 [Dreissena polymorpha]|uniref:Uncharacterized protein n=1 Tax=Dreissena polymorpha TaxID=45954 RepID=A0A9D4NIK8_DREPO|nr:hypothetical protein DPMN_019518 [Dreissena polymorpha]
MVAVGGDFVVVNGLGSVGGGGSVGGVSHVRDVRDLSCGVVDFVIVVDGSVSGFWM